MKKIFVFFLFLFVVWISFAEDNNKKTLYSCEVYGQSFELVEYTDGNRCRLLLFMADNKTTQTRTYDPALLTVYFIWSKWFTSPSEYSNAVESSKNFLKFTTNYIYLAEMKDTCDIAPCCTSIYYGILESRSKEKYIFIEYECSDLDLLFKIAYVYNRKGRNYVLENYPK